MRGRHLSATIQIIMRGSEKKKNSYFKKFHFRSPGFYLSFLLHLLKNNKAIVFVAIFYLVISFLQLNWGLPSNAHPFSYHMDEWAQAHSLRTTFKNGTPHIQGGGNGTVFFYVQSGIMLVPFLLFGFTNPFAIKSSLDFYTIQHSLFVALRLQSFLYAALSILLIAYLAVKYFKTNKFIAAFFIAVNPLFFTLTQFYRYDTPVIFWILLSIYFSLRYMNGPTKKNFYISVVVACLACTIKVSALPLLVTSISSYFLVTPDWKKNLKTPVLGVLLYIIVFFVTGIPDFLISYKQFLNWFSYSAFTVAIASNKDTQLGMPYWLFFLLYSYPASFGYVAYVLFVGSSAVWTVLLIRSTTILKGWKYFLETLYAKSSKSTFIRNQIFLFFACAMFVLSLVPLTLGAHGNRLFVLLPFMGLIISIVLQRFYALLKKNQKVIFIVVLTIGMLYQTANSLAWVSTKLLPDPRQTSSSWISQHIPRGSQIGLENIPIFEYIPDVLLKDFYTQQYFPKQKGIYTYQVIDNKSVKIPEYVIITNYDVTQKYIILSDKANLVNRLLTSGYHPIATFRPDLQYFKLFSAPDLFYLSSILPTPDSITVYKK